MVHHRYSDKPLILHSFVLQIYATGKRKACHIHTRKGTESSKTARRAGNVRIWHIKWTKSDVPHSSRILRLRQKKLYLQILSAHARHAKPIPGPGPVHTCSVHAPYPIGRRRYGVTTERLRRGYGAYTAGTWKEDARNFN